ncbi:MAG: PKD domain-containing protein [Thermoguttaceae bacterium]
MSGSIQRKAIQLFGRQVDGRESPQRTPAGMAEADRSGEESGPSRKRWARAMRALLVPAVLAAVAWGGATEAEIVRAKAKDTLTAVEMNHGDELQFQLREGRAVSVDLADTGAALVEKVEPGGIVYRFWADVRVDGQPVRLERYVCTQECFYEPWVIDGLTIWLDTVRDVFDLVPVRYPETGNLQCVPRKAARFAVQDAALRICPDRVLPWIELDGASLDVSRCYNGDDCYLGPYLGQACHVGMDINQTKGSILRTPIAVDAQAYFNSLAAGDNNNRWRGIRRWPNGDTWALQSHHLIELLVAEKQPLAAGVEYTTTAGVHVGSHEHTHFEFKIGRPGKETAVDPASIGYPIDFDDTTEPAGKEPDVLHLDPWIIFWQALEDERDRHGAVRAAMGPLLPARTGQEVWFSSADSRPGPGNNEVRSWWRFGDSGTAEGAAVSHTFPRAGVFAVQLVVDDGTRRDRTIRWITVTGAASDRPALGLVCEDEPSFDPWPSLAPEVYGDEGGADLPCTVHFVARASRPRPAVRRVLLRNLGGGALDGGCEIRIDYSDRPGWLAARKAGEQGSEEIALAVDATGLEAGAYKCSVEVRVPGSLNGAQRVRVELLVRAEAPGAGAIVDNGGAGFYATPYSWVGHRFCRCPAERRGHGGFYLASGGRAGAGQYARFTPDLEAGKYAVSLSGKTPFFAGAQFNVRVRHAEGDSRLRMRPAENRRVGVYEFEEGTDGYVEIQAEDSEGLVIADAVEFRPE